VGQIDFVYTDFEKAFDRVPNQRLLSKLYSFNINEEIIKWIKAYLDNRTQRVKINNSYSNWVKCHQWHFTGVHLRTSPFYYIY